MNKRLVRPRHDRVIAGVCASIGNYFGVDPTLVRVLAVLLALWSCGTMALIYLVLALIIPLEPEQQPAIRESDSPAVND